MVLRAGLPLAPILIGFWGLDLIVLGIRVFGIGRCTHSMVEKEYKGLRGQVDALVHQPG